MLLATSVGTLTTSGNISRDKGRAEAGARSTVQELWLTSLRGTKPF